MTTALALRNRQLDRYIAEVSNHPVLNREDEQRLAWRYHETGEVAAAHSLVVSNLRFVVKVAHEYRGYGLKLLDLIQEGNLGLMHAVKKFEPAKGYRLISYAVWWIRAQIQAYILRSWSLVKLGSGRVRRKLFFKLRSARSRVERDLATESMDDGLSTGGSTVVNEELARRLGVSYADIEEMEARMAARDFSLDAPLADDTGASSHLDMLSESDWVDPEESASRRQEHEMLTAAIDVTSDSLNDKERVVLDQRLLSDEPKTLAQIGTDLGVTRERVRQIEQKLVGKLRTAVQQQMS